jgi:hypothetical protein
LSMNSPASFGRDGRAGLNSGAMAAYIEVFRNQRKEVIQCLISSAVTSLGSPARLRMKSGIGALPALDQRDKKSGATGFPAAPFSWPVDSLPLYFAGLSGLTPVIRPWACAAKTPR